MIYITGDVHRDFKRLNKIDYKQGDMIIILGDAGINYALDIRDKILKYELNKLGIKLFCVRGNHEERPENINTYKEIEMFGGKVFMEEEYPNLIFAKDGEVYNISGLKVLVIGGAYSIDKNYRIINGYKWFKDEQLTKEEMNDIYKKINGKHFDIVLSHTCPYKYEPREVFLDFIDEALVDKNMECFLNKVEENITYDKWYCGHYHTDKLVDKMRFMFNDVEEFTKELKHDKILLK